MKKIVLRNFARLTGNHLCQTLFFNKVADQPTTLLGKDSGTGIFPVNFSKFLRTEAGIQRCSWKKVF